MIGFSRPFWRWAPAIALAVGTHLAGADDALSKAALQDGLEELTALAWPGTTKAEWGHSDLMQAARSPYGDPFGRSNSGPDTKGNVWLFTHDDGSRWISNIWGTTLTLLEDDSAWNPAVLKEDFDAALAYFQGDEKDRKSQAAGAWNRPNDPNANRSQALIYSAILNLAGATTESETVARLAMEGTATLEREAVVVQAMTMLGTTELRALTAGFRSDQNWGDFASGLRSLLDRFGGVVDGWRALEVLASLTEERATTQDGIPPLQWTGEPPSAEKEAIIAEWLENTEVEEIHSVWILPIGGKRHDASAFPFNLGREAVPLLAGLLADHTLTSRIPEGHGMAYYGGHSFDPSGSEGPSAASVRSEFEQLYDRPRTRAELAMSLLKSVIPSDWQSSLQGTPGEAQAKVILDWWNNFKDLPDLELALQYLKSGDQTGEVLSFVIEHGNEATWTQVEDALLEEVQIYSVRNVEIYAAARGEDARPFVDRVIEKIQSADNRYFADAKQMEEQLKRSIDSLELALSSGSSTLGDFLDAMVKGETPPEALYSSIQRASQKTPPADLVDACLERIDRSDDPKVVQILLRFALVAVEGQGDATAPLETAEAKRLLEKHRDHLTSFIQKAGEMSANSPHGSFDDPAVVWTSVHNFACVLTLSLHEGDVSAQMGKLAALSPLGRKLVKVRQTHALAVLAGDDSSKLPSADSVSQTRVDEILKSLDDTDVASTQSILDQLSDSERLALWQKIGGLTEDWPSALLSLARTIRTVEVPDAMQEIVKGLSLEGAEVSSVLLHDLAARLTAHSGEDQILQLALTQGALHEGWTLSLRWLDEWPKWGLKNQALGMLHAATTALEKAENITVGFTHAGARNQGTRLVWLEQPLTIETIKAQKLPDEESSEVAVAERRALQQEELEAWKSLQALDRRKSLPWGGAGSIYLFQVSAARLTQPDPGDDDSPDQ